MIRKKKKKKGGFLLDLLSLFLIGWLSYLVMQDLNSTSGKANKARKLGTNLITVQKFFDMVK